MQTRSVWRWCKPVKKARIWVEWCNLSKTRKNYLIFFKDGKTKKSTAEFFNRSKFGAQNYLWKQNPLTKSRMGGSVGKVSKVQACTFCRHTSSGTYSTRELNYKFNLFVTTRRTLQIFFLWDHMVNKKMMRAPMLTKQHIHSRVARPETYIEFTQDYWRHVIFSVEKKFSLDVSICIAHYWQTRTSNRGSIYKRQQDRKLIMIWKAQCHSVSFLI